MIGRDEISQVMQEATVDADTADGRNAQRRQAVETFLAGQADYQSTMGSAHAMILSDLESYREWEKDGTVSGADASQHPTSTPWRRQAF